MYEWGATEWFNNAPRHLIEFVPGGKSTLARDEIVVLQQMLPHRVNKGYVAEQFVFRVISHVDGTEVKNLAHLKAMLLAPRADSALVHLRAVKSVNDETMALILPVAEGRKSDAEIHALYNIPKEN